MPLCQVCFGNAICLLSGVFQYYSIAFYQMYFSVAVWIFVRCVSVLQYGSLSSVFQYCSMAFCQVYFSVAVWLFVRCVSVLQYVFLSGVFQCCSMAFC